MRGGWKGKSERGEGWGRSEDRSIIPVSGYLLSSCEPWHTIHGEFALDQAMAIYITDGNTSESDD